MKTSNLWIALGAVVLSWVGASPALSAEPPAAPKAVIQGFMFPTTMTIKAGAALTWVNKDQEPHTVVSDTGLFRSGALDTNDTFAFKFDKSGTYRIHCSLHPQMVSTIVVE